jgi:hypothetical protein
MIGAGPIISKEPSILNGWPWLQIKYIKRYIPQKRIVDFFSLQNLAIKQAKS